MRGKGLKASERARFCRRVARLKGRVLKCAECKNDVLAEIPYFTGNKGRRAVVKLCGWCDDGASIPRVKAV